MGVGSVTSKAIPNVHIVFIMIFMEAGLIIHCVWLDLKRSYGHSLNAHAGVYKRGLISKFGQVFIYIRILSMQAAKALVNLCAFVARHCDKNNTSHGLAHVLVGQIICTSITCKFGNFREGFIFAKIKSSRNGEIALSFTDIGKTCPSRKFLTSQDKVLAQNSMLICKWYIKTM